MKQYNSLFTEYDSLPPDDQLTAREEAFKDCYEQNARLLQAVNDKDQELFESQELVAELLEALEYLLNYPEGKQEQAENKAADILRKVKGE